MKIRLMMSYKIGMSMRRNRNYNHHYNEGVKLWHCAIAVVVAYSFMSIMNWLLP